MSRLAVLLFPLISVFVGLAVSEPSIVAYRKTVGPAVSYIPMDVPQNRAPTSRLIVVDWNVHVGNGDVPALVDKISAREKAAGHGRPEFVLLLEESVRQSSTIPASTGFKVPGRIARRDVDPDISALARRMGWWMYYAPSMRNGDGLGALAEDRGNAILSSLPLQSVEALELPFAAQRRVALVATVTDAQSQPRLRVAVTHFDTRASMTRGWILGGPNARNDQAKELIRSLKKFQRDGLPLVVGGDLNSYIGSQSAIQTMSTIGIHTNCGDKPTLVWGLTLDHMFTDVPSAWTHECHRADSAFGSDHYPLVLSLNVPW
jgi:endonuclease/exonuclease/phosphatase family metal-dependent hydrolase